MSENKTKISLKAWAGMYRADREAALAGDFDVQVPDSMSYADWQILEDAFPDAAYRAMRQVTDLPEHLDGALKQNDAFNAHLRSLAESNEYQRAKDREPGLTPEQFRDRQDAPPPPPDDALTAQVERGGRITMDRWLQIASSKPALARRYDEMGMVDVPAHIADALGGSA